MTLAKRFRIPTKSISSFLFSKRGRRVLSSFTLIFKENNRHDFRLAVLVSKKTDKRSTVRNSLKRKIRQAFETILKKYSILPFDFIVLPKKELLIKNQDELTMEILNLLLKENLVTHVKRASS